MTMGRDYHRNYIKKYYKRKRSEYIKLLGGSCSKCGSEIELQFDHIDPSIKTFNIGKLLNYSKAKVLEELKKCQLLCIECHDNKTKENKDGYLKNKCFGSRVSTAILNEQQVLDIIAKKKAGLLLKDIMIIYPDIKKSTLYAIISKRSWKHLWKGD